MEMIGRIRRMHRRDRKSVREIARATGLSRNTVAKWLDETAPPEPKYRRRPRPTKLEPFHDAIVRALTADARRPRRERRTALALLKELRAQGYAGGYSRLTDFVRAWRSREGAAVTVRAFVPLALALGEAYQFDCSEENLVVGGIYRRVQLAHMKLCASRAFFLATYPSQGREMPSGASSTTLPREPNAGASPSPTSSGTSSCTAHAAEFRCDTESLHSGSETLVLMQREANVFAGNLLMPGDLFAKSINEAHIDLHFLSELASRFEVSFEALCIRLIQFTNLRAVLVCWDNGFLDYECRSSKARLTRARVHRRDDPQEPLPGTLAADPDVHQEWTGIEMPAALWCAEEAPHMKLREFKHSYREKERVLSLLILESAEPRPWDTSWHDEPTQDSHDRFNVG